MSSNDNNELDIPLPRVKLVQMQECQRIDDRALVLKASNRASDVGLSWHGVDVVSGRLHELSIVYQTLFLPRTETNQSSVGEDNGQPLQLICRVSVTDGNPNVASLDRQQQQCWTFEQTSRDAFTDDTCSIARCRFWVPAWVRTVDLHCKWRSPCLDYFRFVVATPESAQLVCLRNDCWLYTSRQIHAYDVFDPRLPPSGKSSVLSKMHDAIWVYSRAQHLDHWLSMRQSLVQHRITATRLHCLGGSRSNHQKKEEDKSAATSGANDVLYSHLERYFARPAAQLAAELQLDTETDVGTLRAWLTSSLLPQQSPLALVFAASAAEHKEVQSSDNGNKLTMFLSDDLLFHSDFEAQIYEVTKYLPARTDCVLWGIGDWLQLDWQLTSTCCTTPVFRPNVLPNTAAHKAFSASPRFLRLLRSRIAKELMRRYMTSSGSDIDLDVHDLLFRETVVTALHDVISDEQQEDWRIQVCNPYLFKTLKSDGKLMITSTADSKSLSSSLPASFASSLSPSSPLVPWQQLLERGVAVETARCQFYKGYQSAIYAPRPLNRLPTQRITVLLVVTDAYLFPAELSRVFHSIRSQSYSNVQLICIDCTPGEGNETLRSLIKSCSAGNSIALVRGRQDQLGHLIYDCIAGSSTPPSSFSSAAAAAATQASGSYILLHNTEGVSAPHRLALQLNALILDRPHSKKNDFCFVSACERGTDRYRNATSRVTRQEALWELCLYPRQLLLEVLSNGGICSPLPGSLPSQSSSSSLQPSSPLPASPSSTALSLPVPLSSSVSQPVLDCSTFGQICKSLFLRVAHHLKCSTLAAADAHQPLVPSRYPFYISLPLPLFLH